jgi:hypothetical protein
VARVREGAEALLPHRAPRRHPLWMLGEKHPREAGKVAAERRRRRGALRR